MFLLLPPLLFLLLSTQYVFVTSSTTPYPTFNGYQARELTGNITQRFALEAQLWSGSSLVQSNTATSCGGYLLLGGYDILNPNGFFQRKYTGLPAHNMIYFQLRAFLLDNWQTSDNFILQFDNKNIIPQNLKKVKTTAESSNICGQDSIQDLKWYTIIGKITHSKTTLTFNIKSNLSSTPDIASFGFRDISLIFISAQSPLTEQVCFRATDTGQFGLSGECSCPRGTYVSSTSPQTCSSCDSSCVDCFGPSANQCYICKDGYSFVGNQCIKCDNSCLTCSGPGAGQCTTCQQGLWLHPNSTCLANCNYPDFAKEKIGDFLVCKVPCGTEQYLLWNNTCGSTCPAPYVQQTLYNVKYCNLPCQSNEFVFSNSSCTDTCESPFVTTSLDGNISLCSPPCSNTTDFYYTANGSCLSTCTAPMLQINGSDFLSCDLPCQTNEYLFLDGSCVSSCNVPFVITEENGNTLCSSPCNNSSYYFYPAEDTCKSTCQAPYVATNYRFINICEEEEEDSSTQSGSGGLAEAGQIATTTEQAVIMGITAKSLASPRSSNSLSTVALAKMFQYIRYMKIKYPPKLTKMLTEQNVNSLSISLSPNIPQNVEQEFTKYPLPARFDQYGIHSSFLVNFWEELFTIIVVIVIVIASSVITPRVTKHKYIHMFFNRVKLITRWDFFILIVASNYDGIVLFSSLEFRTVHFNSFQAVFSFLTCIIMNILGIYILAKSFYVVRDLYRARFKISAYPAGTHEHSHNPTEKWEHCEILFINSKENSFAQYAFMFFFLLRICLFNAIISYLFNYPLAQAICITIMSSIMLLYLAIKRPIKKIFDLAQLFINEILLFIVNINVCIFAVLDKLELSASSSRTTIEDIIIISNLVFSLLSALFLAIEVIIGLYRGVKAFRASKAKGLRALAHTLFVLCEQEGLNLEEHDTPHDSIHIINSPDSPEQPKFLLSPGSNIGSIILPHTNNLMNNSFQTTPTIIESVEPDSTTKALTSRPTGLSGFAASRKISDTTTSQSPLGIYPIKLGDIPSPVNVVVTPSPIGSINFIRRKCSAEEDIESNKSNFVGSLVVDSVGTLKELDVQKGSLLSISGPYRSRVRLQLAKMRGLRKGSSNLSTKEEIESKNELSTPATKSPNWKQSELGKVFFKKQTIEAILEDDVKGNEGKESVEVKVEDVENENKKKGEIKEENK